VWGLNITAGSSIVRGLSIAGFGGDGIRLTVNGGNRIESNYIGVSSDGVHTLQNSWGVSVGSASNVIGGLGAGEGNVVSGNTSGVVLVCVGSTGNVVVGNLVGTSPDRGNRSSTRSRAR
jgi:hypothetical protein